VQKLYVGLVADPAKHLNPEKLDLEHGPVRITLELSALFELRLDLVQIQSSATFAAAGGTTRRPGLETSIQQPAQVRQSTEKK